VKRGPLLQIAVDEKIGLAAKHDQVFDIIATYQSQSAAIRD
jgi:hypothetical protein